MAYKVWIPPAVMRELDMKREDLVSAAPEAKTQAGRQERTFTAHQLCVWSWAGGNQSRCDASPGYIYSSVEGEGDLSGSAEGMWRGTGQVLKNYTWREPSTQKIRALMEMLRKHVKVRPRLKGQGRIF